MTLAALTGAGLGLGGAKLYNKVTGKTAGAPASMAHVLTNDKLDKQAKKQVIGEQLKEGLKDTAKLAGITAGVAGTAALVTGCSNKAGAFANRVISGIGNWCSNVKTYDVTLGETIKDTKLYQKVRTLSTPAKAAIGVAAAFLALATPIAALVSAQKAGYIEGKHEAK